MTQDSSADIHIPTHEEALDDNLFTITLDWRRWWSIIPEIVALACAGILPAIIAAQVLSRYTDWFTIFWADDVIKVLFLWVVFLGGAIAVKYEAHVRMTLFSALLERPPYIGAIWPRLIRLSPGFAGALLLYLGITLVRITMHRELPSLQISAGYFMTIVPISGALMLFYALHALWLDYRQRHVRSAGQL
jgi:TRAP-type C4-dicarboxylate transport system permease small subunit